MGGLSGSRYVRRLSLAILLALGACESGDSQVQCVEVVSPGGGLQMTVTTDDDGRMTYSVVRDGQVEIESSPLGLLSTSHDLTAGVTMSSGSRRTLDESYTTRTGKRRERVVRGSEITVPLEDANGARAELVLRAHLDGVAFRYRLLGEGESEVMSESTGFAIPAGARVLSRAYDGGEFTYVATAGEYQQPPSSFALGEAIDATGFAFPTLFEMQEGTHYAMVSEADLDRNYCGTRLDEMPEGGLYRVRFPDEREGRGTGEVLPRAPLPLTTPWRVIVLGDLSRVVGSTLIDDLSRPTVVDDQSWIEPGRAAWSWFTQGTGTPELQSEYIDFAGEFGWDYVLIDANWDDWDDPEQAVTGLVARADAVGVKLMLWYNSGGPNTPLPNETPLNRMLDPVRRDEMKKISDWGIAGIKVDFFNSDKQDRINQYIGILEDAKDFELLVNFHGCTVPRGWQRTYPHLMTQEAVNGAEVYKFGGAQDVPTALTNVRHVLLRNIVGSMDYTPVVFEAALESAALPYAHSLALSVLFESGIQHFADRADSNPDAGYRSVFSAYPFVGDLMSTVPVAWDDTTLLSGDIDDHVMLGRRAGTQWYLAGIHALDTQVQYSLPLGFLEPDTSYDLVLIEQDQAPDSFRRTPTTIQAGAPLTITLPPNGGFIAILTPQ